MLKQYDRHWDELSIESASDRSSQTATDELNVSPAPLSFRQFRCASAERHHHLHLHPRRYSASEGLSGFLSFEPPRHKLPTPSAHHLLPHGDKSPAKSSPGALGHFLSRGEEEEEDERDDEKESSPCSSRNTSSNTSEKQQRTPPTVAVNNRTPPFHGSPPLSSRRSTDEDQLSRAEMFLRRQLTHSSHKRHSPVISRDLSSLESPATTTNSSSGRPFRTTPGMYRGSRSDGNLAVVDPRQFQVLRLRAAAVPVLLPVEQPPPPPRKGNRKLFTMSWLHPSRHYQRKKSSTENNGGPVSGCLTEPLSPEVFTTDSEGLRRVETLVPPDFDCRPPPHAVSLIVGEDGSPPEALVLQQTPSPFVPGHQATRAADHHQQQQQRQQSPRKLLESFPSPPEVVAVLPPDPAAAPTAGGSSGSSSSCSEPRCSSASSPWSGGSPVQEEVPLSPAVELLATPLPASGGAVISASAAETARRTWNNDNDNSFERQSETDSLVDLGSLRSDSSSSLSKKQKMGRSSRG